MLNAKVIINLKKTVLDPQGKTIKHSLEVHDFPMVSDVRCGKYIEIKLAETNTEKAFSLVEAMCQKLLSNPVIEDYQIEIVEGEK